MSTFDALQARLGHRFREPALLRLALTHPSISHEAGSSQAHNQRLEYLGDAVLQLALTRELYDRYPQHDEGPLTKIRAQLVNQVALAEQGRALGLGEHLVLSRGEQLNGGRERPSILADAYEAVLGALFLDGGYEVACAFILRTFAAALADIESAPGMDNPKGALQEILQAISDEAPQYQVLSASGPDHDRSFECAVLHKGEEIGRGTGKSKKLAESQAATAALTRLRTKHGVE
ncbi:MAG: ribonuclease III [Verrucomicrobia bacterium]|nr:ribonuclease III [Verrucomicrobiota bacterium]NBU11236.1 ribonuclease III [Pseudomonadota bacterium]NDA65879.1 ribonuclease III [Verrucomicrobiota bacterium]NDB74817.1 ribonuclease III [Verrucomicrobiota bacterium]NDD37727.1 ribonuclease III [Verrucomicrobiota bacterium]